MPASEQENGGLAALLGAPPAAKPSAAPAQPFRFAPPRALIDWRALHALDVAAIARDTDIDALERVLDVVAFGDIEAEDSRTLTPCNFIQLFRVAQLTLGYLLHVQDRLAADCSAARAELARAQHRAQLLGLKVKEVKEELAGSRKEARHLKKSLKTLEALALARSQAPPPLPAPAASEQRLVERLMEAAAQRAERAEAQAAHLAQERASLQRELAAAADAAAAAVDKARREERAAAEAQLQAAIDEERRRSSAKLSVVVSGDESPGLQSKLAAAHRAQREAERRAAAAEMQLAAAAAAAGRAAAAPAAEGRRLRAAQEASQAEADMLRSQLAAEQRGRGRQPREQEEARSPCERSGARRAGGGGLAAQLEDDADEARVQQLEERVIAAEAARAAIAARCKQLEQQLRQQPAQGGGGGRPGSAPAAGIGAAAEAEAQEVERLQEEKAALEAECSRLRQGATQSAEEIEPFSQQQLQQAGSPQRGSGTPTPQRSRSASPTKAGTLHRLAGSSGSPGPTQHPKQAERQQESGPAAKGGIGSPIEEPAGSLPDAAAAPQSSGKQQRPGSPGAASPHAQPPSPCSPARHVACSPSEADRQQFRREMQHTLRTAQRPGVVSRFPHSLGSFLALRGDLEGELEAELAAELASYGIDPAAEGITADQLSEAMAELERRRADTRAAMTAADRQRLDYMRATVEWHVQQTAELASGQRSASPTRHPPLVQPPTLRPIRTYSNEGEAHGCSLHSPRRGLVEQVMEEVGDEAAVYSPLARGASVLSERGYLEEGGWAGTPRSSRSPTPGADGAGSRPRSPWSAGHSRSPVGSGADVTSPHWRQQQVQHARAVRSVQFEGMQEGPVAQRVGRRPSFSGQQGGGQDEQQLQAWGASRDWDTGDAAPVRPAARRAPRG